MVVDTLRDLIWLQGFFAGGDTIQSSNLIGYNGASFITANNIDTTFGNNTTDLLMYQGKIIFSSKYSVYSYDVDSQHITLLGIFPTSSYPGGLCLSEYNGDLIVAGQFFAIKKPGGLWVTTGSIARWDGNDWHTMDAAGLGLWGSGTIVHKMQVYNSKLFVGGNFQKAGNIDAWGIASWDGSNWACLCNGTGRYGIAHEPPSQNWNATISDIEVINEKLYIVGNFDSVCNIKTYLAYWNDTFWVGNIYPYYFNYKIKSFGSHIVITSGDALPQIFYWNGISPIGVDSGFSSGNTFLSLINFHDTLYAAGYMQYSGNTPLFNFARLVPDSLINISAGICSGESYNFNGVLLDSAGVYTDTLIDASGLDSIVVLTLNVTSVTSSISISNDTITATGNGIIQWYDCDSHQIIVGAAGNTFVPSVSGNYAAIVSNNNCADTTNCINVIAGVSNLSGENRQIKIYPNPASEKLTISSKQSEEKIVVMDITGRMVFQASTNTPEIDVSSLASGMYLLRVEFRNGDIAVGKFVKE
ncbi:hypothetical protein LBMAG27_00780 [Bacteroidota bacterium]|nr:hypothetical protein LBMAG27_00780 [Bacteroidota bacterium]